MARARQSTAARLDPESSIDRARGHRFWWRILNLAGPGLITGASDDDPSGIATYSQVGAQFRYGMLWTQFFTTPLMIAIQEVSAWLGRVTGEGIAANLERAFGRPLMVAVAAMFAFANIFNL